MPGRMGGEPRQPGLQRDPRGPPSTRSTSSAARPWLRRDSDKNNGPRARLIASPVGADSPTAVPRSTPSTAPPAPAGSSSSPPAPAACGEPDPDRRSAASTAPRAAARRHKPGPASPGCGPARAAATSRTPSHCCSPGIHGSLAIRGHQPAPGSRRPAPRGRITAAADRVGLAHALLHQKVVKQPHRHQPLLHRRVRQPRPGSIDDHVPAPAARPGGQLPYEHRDMSPGRGERVDLRPARTPAGTPPGPRA